MEPPAEDHGIVAIGIEVAVIGEVRKGAAERLRDTLGIPPREAGLGREHNDRTHGPSFIARVP